VELNIRTNGKNSYNIFTNARVQSIEPPSQSAWDEMVQAHALQSGDRDLMRRVQMQIYSDQVWAITPPSKSALKAFLETSVNDTSRVVLEMQYKFTRNLTGDAFSKVSTDLNSGNKRILLDMLNCESSANELSVTDMYPGIQRLDSSSAPTPVTDIVSDGTDKFASDIAFGLKDCNKSGESYWYLGNPAHSDSTLFELEEEGDTTGITFYVICERVSMVALHYSVFGFYISVVYLIGKQKKGGE